ncbi:MAG: type VII toxin-antitoxin system MntA family adenylyltransferase antitoxin [Candidatus Kryptoniota bacterium]
MSSQTNDAIEEKVHAIIQVLRSNTSVAAAYIYGSFGTSRFNADSDIDIGILNEKTPKRIFDGGYFELKAGLESAAGIEVDLVILNTASPILCMQVLKYGRKIFEKDARAANEFFVRTVGSYADLKRVRRPIEQRVLEGRIYGRS